MTNKIDAKHYRSVLKLTPKDQVVLPILRARHRLILLKTIFEKSVMFALERYRC